MTRWHLRVVSGLAVLSASSRAFAHGAAGELGGFYSGVLHPLTIPAHVMALVVLGLLIAKQPLRQVQTGLVLTPAALVIGFGLTLSLKLPMMETGVLIVTLFGGLALALLLVAPKWLALSFCVAAGVLIGLDSNPEQRALQDNLILGAGTLLSCMVVLGYAILIERNIKLAWKGLAIRVLGSWIAAASAMVVALRLI